MLFSLSLFLSFLWADNIYTPMLSNTDIEQLCKKYNILLRGIHLRDTLPKSKILAGFYIYNLDDSKVEGNGEIGTHWTCSIGNDKELLYFDSFGAVPNIETDRFIKTKYKKYGCNNWIIQDMDSELCGYFCIGLALFVKLYQRKYRSLFACCNDYINRFADDTKLNDERLRTFFRTHSPK